MIPKWLAENGGESAGIAAQLLQIAMIDHVDPVAVITDKIQLITVKGRITSPAMFADDLQGSHLPQAHPFSAAAAFSAGSRKVDIFSTFRKYSAPQIEDERAL